MIVIIMITAYNSEINNVALADFFSPIFSDLTNIMAIMIMQKISKRHAPNFNDHIFPLKIMDCINPKAIKDKLRER